MKIINIISGAYLSPDSGAFVYSRLLTPGTTQLSEWIAELKTPMECHLQIEAGWAVATLFVPTPGNFPAMPKPPGAPPDVSTGLPLATICICTDSSQASAVWHRHIRAASDRIKPGIQMPGSIPWASFQGHFPYEMGDKGTKAGTEWIASGLIKAITAKLLE